MYVCMYVLYVCSLQGSPSLLGMLVRGGVGAGVFTSGASVIVYNDVACRVLDWRFLHVHRIQGPGKSHDQLEMHSNWLPIFTTY